MQSPKHDVTLSLGWNAALARRRPARWATIAVLIAAAVAAPALSRQEWPRWRGPNADGVATASDVFSRPFRLEVAWRKTLGSGYSALSIADGHVIVMFSDGERDVVASLSAERGAEEWRLPIAPTFRGREGSNDGPVSTPAIEAGVVYALGPRGDLVAIDLETGGLVWRRQLVDELGAALPHWGFGSSPLVVGDLVVVLTGGAEGGAVTALERRTGRTVWRTGSDDTNYQSPILLRSADRERIVVAGDRFLFFLDPKTGRELSRWEHGGQGFYRRIINPTVVAPDTLLLTHQSDSASAVHFGPRGAEVVWTSPNLKLNYAPPVEHDGLVFGYSGDFLTCTRADSGELCWKSRPPGNGFPILVDDHLVIQTKEGTLAVAEASPDGYHEVASLELFERLGWTPPSFAEGRIYSRDSYAEVAAVDVVPLQAPAAVTSEQEASPERGTVPSSRFAQWVREIEGRPDAEQRVADFLARQESFPIIEGERIVHFVYHGDANDVALSGGMLELGQELPMHRVAGTRLYYASFELEPDARMVYQFVRNLEEPIVDPLNPGTSRSLLRSGEVSIVTMPRARSLAVAPATRQGRIVEVPFETPQVEQDGLTWGGERRVRVYLPPGYDDESSRRFPTAYVLYGTRLLDYEHLDRRLDAALGARIEPTIVVLMQPATGYEYARSQRRLHADMLAREMVPRIDSEFRTRAEPEQRALIGADEGGYGAVESGLRYPEVFGKVAAMSVFPVAQGASELLALVDEADPGRSVRFVLDWGRHDVAYTPDSLDVAAYTETLSDRLRARGFEVTSRESNDASDLPFWAQRTVDALALFFPANDQR